MADNLHIDLFNFEDEKFEDSKYILTSPRSLDACSRLAIKPVELLPRPVSEFKEEFLPRGLPIRTICSLHREHERERLNKLHLCIEERQRIIDREKHNKNVNEPNARPVHIVVERDSVDGLGDFSDEDDVDSGGAARARTAWTTSIGHQRITADELNNRALELLAEGGKTERPRGRKKRGRRRATGGVTHRRSSSRGSNASSRRGSLSREYPSVTTSRRCLSDLGYGSRAGSQETLGSSVDVHSTASLTARDVRTKRLFAGVRPVTDPLLKRQLGGALKGPVRLREKDQKILTLMAAKRLDEERHVELSESAHRQWQVEQQQMAVAAAVDEARRRRSLARRRRKQELHRLEMLTRLEQMEEEKRCEREQEVEKTLRASLTAVQRQEITKIQTRMERQKEDAMKKALVEQRLGRRSAEDEAYRNELQQWRQQKMRRAITTKTLNEQGLAMKTHLRNRSSQEKHGTKMAEIRQQSIDDRINLRNSIEVKLQRTGDKFNEEQHRRHAEIQHRQRELDKKIQLSKQKQSLMETDLNVWRENLLNFRTLQAGKAERTARETVDKKSKTAHVLRSEKEKLHQENVKKLAERENQWKHDMERTLAHKEARVKTLQDERDKMILESRALAGASQRLREQLRTNFSTNDLDQLGKRTELENQLLFKQRHYVSRFNPLNASSITLG